MAEAKDIVKIGIMITAVVFFGSLAAGFYFAITGNTGGHAFLQGGFETVLTGFFNFVAAPFTGITKAINSFFNNLHI